MFPINLAWTWPRSCCKNILHHLNIWSKIIRTFSFATFYLQEWEWVCTWMCTSVELPRFFKVFITFWSESPFAARRWWSQWRRMRTKSLFTTTFNTIGLGSVTLFFWENWKKSLWTFVCHNKTSHTFGNFGHVLPFSNEKNSKLNFKNVKKYEKCWKHKYDNIYV